MKTALESGDAEHLGEHLQSDPRALEIYLDLIELERLAERGDDDLQAAFRLTVGGRGELDALGHHRCGAGLVGL
jgi:hypothetical protein